MADNFCDDVYKTIWWFLKPTNGLTDPKGSLSACLPLQVIALANKEVQNVVNETAATKKCGPYKRWDICALCRVVYVG